MGLTLAQEAQMSNTRELGHGMVVYSLDDGTITLFRGSKFSRKSIDVWAQAVLEDIKRDHKNIAHLHDMRGSSVAITPYARKKLQDVGEDPGNEGFVALVMDRGPLTSIVRFFAQREFRQDQPKVVMSMFHDYDEALAWLRERVSERKRST
jgi:hypothetical protein